MAPRGGAGRGGGAPPDGNEAITPRATPPAAGAPRAMPAGAGALRVMPAEAGGGARAFLDLPAALGPLGWGVPLRWEERRVFDPGFNRFLDDHAVARFVAWRGAEPVGRVAACVPLAGPGPASFGFLRATRDPAVVAALLDAARGFAAGHGRASLDGPLSFTINHEVGAQVAGFGAAPMLRMPRTPDWLPPMIEAAGFAPLQDVLACTLELGAEGHRARFAQLAAARPDQMRRLALRRFDRRHFAAEVGRVAALYDRAWAENAHAVPLRPGEVATLARLLRPLLLGGGEVVFAEWDGRPAGIVSVVPNLEPALPPDGRLWPLGWARLAPALLGRVGSGRVPMLGVVPELRGAAASGIVMGALLDAAIGHAARRGWRRLEISWILAGNVRMLNAMARLPAPVTGRWRLWRGPTVPPAVG